MPAPVTQPQAARTDEPGLRGDISLSLFFQYGTQLAGALNPVGSENYGMVTPWDLAWTLGPEPFGIPLYSHYGYLRVDP